MDNFKVIAEGSISVIQLENVDIPMVVTLVRTGTVLAGGRHFYIAIEDTPFDPVAVHENLTEKEIKKLYGYEIPK